MSNTTAKDKQQKKSEKKSKKGIKLSLAEFLQETGTEKLAWGDRDDELEFEQDQTHEEEEVSSWRKETTEEKEPEKKPVEIDESRIPKEPPFVAYVGNLSYKITQDDLADFFHSLKIKDISIPYDRVKHSAKGFAYIEFETADDLREALHAQGEELLGRPLRIDISDKPIKKRESKFERRGGRKFGGRREEGEYKSRYSDEREHEKYRESKVDKIDNWRKKPDDYVPPEPKDFPRYRDRSERVRKHETKDRQYVSKYHRERPERRDKQRDYERKRTTLDAAKEPVAPEPKESIFGEGKPWEPNEVSRRIEEKIAKERERLEKLYQEQRAERAKKGRGRGRDDRHRREDRQKSDDKPRKEEKKETKEEPEKVESANIFEALSEEIDH